MRITVTLDVGLLDKASKLVGPLDRSALLHEGLKALIERESAKHLAKLGDGRPKLELARRRRKVPYVVSCRQLRLS